MAQSRNRAPRWPPTRLGAVAGAFALASTLLACDLCAEPIVPMDDGPVLISVGLRVGKCPLHPVVEYPDNTPDLLPAGRASHAAILLGDGRVLVLGGSGYGQPRRFERASAQIWDPRTGRWHLVGTPPPTWWAVSTVLRDGRVMFFGPGYFFFDPLTESWAVGGEAPVFLPMPRLAALPSGQILVEGDRWIGSGTVAWAGLYDPATDHWGAVGAPEGPRYGASLTALSDGTALLAGGDVGGGRYEPTNAADLFEPTTGTWRPTGPMTAARVPSFAILLADGRVLVPGHPAELYDPVSETWAPTPNRTEIGAASVALLGDGTVLMASEGTRLYDPDSDEVRLLRPEWRTGHSVTALPDGRALVVGGDVLTDTFETRSLAAAELYDPATGTWTRTGDLLPDP